MVRDCLGAIGPPNGPSAACCGSTRIHWWSPVASANWFTASWVISYQSLRLSSSPTGSDWLKLALHERVEMTIIDAIASSESGPFAFAITRSTNDLPGRLFPVPATKMFTVDGQNVTPGSGETGILAYSGPMPLGYYKGAGRTSTTFRTIGGIRYVIRRL